MYSHSSETWLMRASMSCGDIIQGERLRIVTKSVTNDRFLYFVTNGQAPQRSAARKPELVSGAVFLFLAPLFPAVDFEWYRRVLARWPPLGRRWGQLVEQVIQFGAGTAERRNGRLR
jgi:hypothetical protein